MTELARCRDCGAVIDRAATNLGQRTCDGCTRYWMATGTSDVRALSSTESEPMADN
jgi:hypothetical protein